MPSKKVLAGILVLVILLVGVGVGVFLVRQRQELRKEAAPATTISFQPSQGSFKVGETFSLAVAVDTAQNTATAADLRITFDPKRLILTEFKPGTFLPVPLQAPKVDNSQGVATAIFGAQPGNLPQGKGSLGTLVFQAREAGATSVTLSPQTEVTGKDETTNVLVGRDLAALTILSASGAAAPSPSPASAGSAQTTGSSPSPTASPKAAAQGGASVSLSPSPKTTASPKATASATTKATVSPKPTSSPGELPQAGFELPVIGMLGAGVLVLLLGILLAF